MTQNMHARQCSTQHEHSLLRHQRSGPDCCSPALSRAFFGCWFFSMSLITSFWSFLSFIFTPWTEACISQGPAWVFHSLPAEWLHPHPKLVGKKYSIPCKHWSIETPPPGSPFCLTPVKRLQQSLLKWNLVIANVLESVVKAAEWMFV